MGKDRHSNKKHGNNRYVIVLMFAVLISVSIVSAKYIYTISTQNGIITSDKFYFTTDLTGDSKMINTSGDSVYQYLVGNKGEEDEKATFYLYGGGEHTITFNVRNYDDELRVTDDEIKYTVACIAIKKNETTGSDITTSLSGTTLTTTQAIDSNGEYSLKNEAVNNKAENQYTLSIAGNDYDDETRLVVTIASTTPYVKTITLEFVLYKTNQYLLYEVNDTSASPYAELIIMANTIVNNSDENSGTTTTQILNPVYLKWGDNLSIDNTNSLTYYYSEGLFAQQPLTEDNINYKMQLSRQLNASESVSLYFFKTDTSKTYKQEKQVVAKENNTYTIEMAEQTTTQ